MVNEFRYRPEIDGLRAIAVLVVVFFHAGFGFTGGYVGVDVFFVISGFLITSLILKDLDSGAFGPAQFWARRARRIVPAIVLVVLATLVAGWFILLPADFENLGESAAWQAVFGANIHFWIKTGYFAGVAEDQPLLHTWSLAVEEQFYMIMPLLLLGLFRIRAVGRVRVMRYAFITGIALSLGVSAYAVARHPAAGFYLLPSRAWELLCGAFVAVAPAALMPRSSRLREGLSAFGLAAILIPCWVYTNTTPFPGLAAIPPCLGTAIYVLSSHRQDRGVPLALPSTARVLAMRPVVFIGLISYSLYLWHWPFLVFTRYLSLAPLSAGYRAAVVALSFIAAVLSWRYVETPFRRRQLCPGRAGIFAFAAAGLAFVFALGAGIFLAKGAPFRFPDRAIRYANAANDRSGIHEITSEDVRAGRLVLIGDRNPALPVSLVLWGDSHAMAAAPAFDQFLKEKGLSGRQATASATAPVVEGYWQNEFTTPGEVKQFNDDVFDYLRRNKIPIVVLAAFWEYYTDNRATLPLDSALLTTCRRLVSIGVAPYLLLQVPHPPFAPPKALAMATIFGYNIDRRLAIPTSWNGLRGDGNSFIHQLEAAGCVVLDPRDSFLDQARRHFIVERNGLSLYRDAHHLSADGAQMILAPFLRRTLKPHAM